MQVTCSLLVLLATASSVIAASVSTTQADVSAVHKAATSLNNNVQQNNGSDQNEDLNTDSDFQQLVSAINNAGSDFNSLYKKLTSSQFKPMLSSLQGTEKTTKAICTKLAHDKKHYDAAGISNVISYDIRDLSNAFSSLHSAVKSKAPASASSDVSSLWKSISSDLSTCTKSYPTSS